MDRFIQLINHTNGISNERFNMNIIENIIRELNEEEENNTTEGGQEPAQKEFVDSLEEIEMKEENITCSLCLEEFQLNEKCIRLPCKDNPHYFHSGNENCPGILKWFQKSNTCPVCRHEFPKEEPVPNNRIIVFNSNQNNNPISPNFITMLRNEILRREEERQVELAIQASLNS